ncbi:MAG: hypothetical protein RL571_2658 [Pseudomonadota bacterium]|jgi:hypothetical protein
MEHFNLILAICRIAAQTPSKPLLTQVKRLMSKLEAEGALKEAKALAQVIDSVDIEDKLTPSRLTLSKLNIGWGEPLTRAVKPPVDKESGNPLAEIILSDINANKPVFDTKFDIALDTLINEWTHVNELKENNIFLPMSCLIYGEPGTGKTKTALYMAQKIGLPVIVARLDGLISSFLGTTARNISNLFDFANRYNAVLLLDEFDAIAKIRDDPHELGEIKRVVNTLLQCIDSRLGKGFTIAITNHDKLLDSAVWRRFDSRIFVPKPDSVSRKKIIERYLGSELKGEEVEFLCWLSSNYSGAEIESLCNNLIRQSIISKNNDNLIEKVTNYIQLNSELIEINKRNLILGSQEELAFNLFKESRTQFNQDMLASLFNRDKSTISRWLRKHKEVSNEK